MDKTEAFIARSIAYAWHGGQTSALYALASSGLVQDPEAVLSEIDNCLIDTRTNTLERAELEFLKQFVKENVAALQPT